jgi:hypothetical protein
MTQKQCRTRNQHASGIHTAHMLGWSQGENISREARLEIALRNLINGCDTGDFNKSLNEAKNLIE